MVGPHVTPSHVLLAMGLTGEQAASAVRFSLGHRTTEKEIDSAITILGKTGTPVAGPNLIFPQGHAPAAAATSIFASKDSASSMGAFLPDASALKESTGRFLRSLGCW